MTECTEALRLLARARRILVDAQGAGTGGMADEINAFLADSEPSCDAEKAVLVAAITRIRDKAHEYGALPAEIERLADEELRAAETSPAAAGLLAQVVTLAAVKEYCEKGRSLGDDDVASEVLNIIRGEVED